MADENTSGDEPRSLSYDQAAEALRQSRIPKEEPKPETVEEPEEAEDQAETEAEDDDATEAEEVETDQSEDEADEESEPEGDEDEVYEVDGVQFTPKELREWKEGGLRQADYTKKSQAVADMRKQVEAQQAAFNVERQQWAEASKAEKARLQDQLAAFAIENDPEPSTEGLTWEDYTKRKAAWDKRQHKREEAAQAYRALQYESQTEKVRRETEMAFQHFPEWRQPGGFDKAAQEMVVAAAPYGFSQEDVLGVDDHRLFRVLHRLTELEAAQSTRKQASESAQKKAAKAVRRLAPGAKPDPRGAKESKEFRQKRERLAKTGTIADGVAALQARRRFQA